MLKNFWIVWWATTKIFYKITEKKNKYPGFSNSNCALATPEYNELLTVLSDDFEDMNFFFNFGLRKLPDLIDIMSWKKTR